MTSQPGQLLFAGFEGTRVPPDLGELIAAGRVGGVVLFARNVENPEQLAELTRDLHACAPSDAPLCIAVDQEGGRVQRLRSPWTEWPPMRQLGSRRVEDTAALARALARELADLRIDLCFAPVVDVDSNPANPVIGDRSFSRDPEQVARHGAAVIEALQSIGVAACAKHFPGHGDTAADSHFDLPRVDANLARLRAVELPPFRSAVEAAVASVMTAHILIPSLDPERPATLSQPVIDLLRRDLGYDGLIFSDDLEMKAIADHFSIAEMVRGCLEVDVDALLVCRSSEIRDSVLAQLESLPDALVAQGLRRMQTFKLRFAGGRRATGARAPYSEHLALASRLDGDMDGCD